MANAPKAGNEQGDTAAVDRNLILLAWQMELIEYKKDETTGKAVKSGTATKSVKGDSELYYSEELIKWFDIPVYAGAAAGAASAPKPIIVTAHTRTIYPGGITDSTGKTVQVPEFERQRGVSRGSRQISARVPLGKETTKGTPRTVALAFPGFFTVQMIAQAIGSMIRTKDKDKVPKFFRMPSGASYDIFYDTKEGLLTGHKNGAWVATARVAYDDQQGLNPRLPGPGNDNATSSAGDSKQKTAKP